MVSTDINADIAIPTWEDWARVMSQEGNKYFEGCRSYKYNFSIPWSKKIPTAVFRGSSSGCGTTIETNPRLKVSYLSISQPASTDYKLLDAGITKWTTRPRKQLGNPYLQTVEPQTLPFKLANSLGPEEQSKYKYILNIDGHVSAFRLSLELSMGSVILLVDSKYRLWFKKYLIEYVHYVPVMADLSDLFEKILWCRDNDQKCEEIANNAREFYNKYLTKNGVLDYLQILLLKIKEMTGYYFYNTLKVSDVITEKQQNFFLQHKLLSPSKKSLPNLSIFQKGNRDYYVMEGLRKFLNKAGVNTFNHVKIHESKDGVLETCNIESSDSSSIKFMLKKSQRVNESVNEAFIGINSINHLLAEIPNFRYTYFYDTDKKSVLFEDVEGITLKKYINDGCSLKELNGIFMMLCLALAVAQERTGFVHYDLYPWNIIITKTRKRKINYQFGHYLFTIETDIIPVIIDYGKSSAIVFNEHYGSLKPFETNVFQDCFSLVISSLYEMMVTPVKAPMDDKKINSIMAIVNFYTKTEFYKPQIQTYNDLMSFLNTNKKYNEMIYGNKCGLTKHNPIELFLYLSLLKISVYKGERLSTSSVSIAQINYPQKAEYLSSAPFDSTFYYNIIANIDSTNLIQKYLEGVREFIHPKNLKGLYSAKNMLSFVNGCNNIHMCMTKLKDVSDNFLIQTVIDDIRLNFNNFRPLKNDITIKYINIKKEFIMANYSSETFSVPDKILTILQNGQRVINTDILDFRKEFIFNILYTMPYTIPNEIEFARKYGKYLYISPLVLANHNANINSVKAISKIVYAKDVEVFKKMDIKPEKALRTLKENLILA
jgi:hypothetical protein